MTYGEFERSPVETLLATSLAETRAVLARRSQLRLHELLRLADLSIRYQKGVMPIQPFRL